MLTDTLYIRVCVKHFGMANIKKKLNIGNVLTEHHVCTTVDLNALLVCNCRCIQNQNNEKTQPQVPTYIWYRYFPYGSRYDYFSITLMP